MSDILSRPRIRFSTAPNAMYGLRHLTAILMEMCNSGVSSERAVRTIERHAPEGVATPSAKWFRNMINSLEAEKVYELCDRMIDYTTKFALKTCKSRSGVLVAIDKHLIGRHDKNNMMHLIRSKRKNGTGKFECYASMQLVAGPVTAVLDCLQVTQDLIEADFMRKFMQKLRDYRIRTKLLLVDREFYSTKIINLITDKGYKFLMPASRYPTTKKAIEEHHDGTRDAVSRQTIRNDKGETATFTLAITPSKNHDDEDAEILEKYHAFATNLSVAAALRELKTLPEYYKSRWGIETGYRQIDEVRPRTTSRSQPFRILLFYVALFMFNMWSIERYRYDPRYGMLTLDDVADITVIVALNACGPVGQPYDPGGPG